MDYNAYFRDLADYYNNSRIPSEVITGAAGLRAEFNQPGSWVRKCVDAMVVVGQLPGGIRIPGQIFGPAVRSAS
jgi:hypothetical protein